MREKLIYNIIIYNVVSLSKQYCFIQQFVDTCDATCTTHCCEIRTGLWLGHLMAVEEDGLPVWRQI